MPRARLIKPQFFLDRVIVKLSAYARLLFIGLWTLADREGRVRDEPEIIKVQLLPFDDCEIESLLLELVAGNLISRYESKGLQILQIRSFTKHQHCHVREPASILPAPCQPNARTRQARRKKGPGPSDTEAVIEAEAETVISTQKPSAKTAEEPGKPVDNRSLHPTIQGFRSAMGQYPKEELWDRLIEDVGDQELDVPRLKACRVEWLGRGYNPTNILGWLDWYHNGIPEWNRKESRNGTSTGNHQPNPSDAEFGFRASDSI